MPMQFYDYQNLGQDTSGMFQGYNSGEGTDYSVKSQYQPYMTYVPGSEYQARGWNFDTDAYQAEQQRLAQQAASLGVTGIQSTQNYNFDPNNGGYNTTDYGINPLAYSGQQITNRWAQSAGAGAGSNVFALGGDEVNYLNQNYSDWQTRLAPELERYAYQQQINNPLSNMDVSNSLYSGQIGGGGNWTYRGEVDNMLASIYGDQWQADPWNQIRLGTAGTLDQLEESNKAGGLLSGEIPWQVMLALGVMGGGALGMLGSAGSPMAAGGMLGEVGSGLSGAVASAGGAALDASALAAMGYNPANASLGGLTGATSGGGSLGGANGSWDVLPDAVSSPTGGVDTTFSDFGSNFGPTGDGMYAPTSDPGLAGGGWSAADGSFGSNGLTDIIKQIQQATGNMPSGSTDILKALMGQMGGGGGGTGTGTGGTGTGGLGGMGDIFNWLTSAQGGAGALSGILGYNDAADQTDWMKATMERAVGASDPYGYGPYRKYAADQLQRTYQDPASIYNSAEMQGLDKLFMDKTMAEQAASGNLFNAPERVAQRQNNFYSNLNEYRKPLLQMSGSGQALVAPQTYASFAKSISDLQGDQALAKGNMIGGITGGLNTLFGGGGSTAGQGGLTVPGYTGGQFDLSNIFSGANTGWDTISSWFGGGGAADAASGAADSFYAASDLMDLWL